MPWSPNFGGRGNERTVKSGGVQEGIAEKNIKKWVGENFLPRRSKKTDHRLGKRKLFGGKKGVKGKERF